MKPSPKRRKGIGPVIAAAVIGALLGSGQGAAAVAAPSAKQVAASVSANGGPADRGRAVRQVLAAERRWNTAYLAKDVEAFAALIAPSFVYTSERGVFDKTTYVGNLASGVVDIRGLRSSDQRVRLYGQTAIVTGLATLQATLNGQDISGRDDYTRVWIRRSGRWLAVTQHASVRPPQAAPEAP
jgi:ketosteroid isomerase-like protein